MKLSGVSGKGSLSMIVVNSKLHGLTLCNISPLSPDKQLSAKSRVSQCDADIYTRASIDQYIQMLILSLYLVQSGATAPDVPSFSLKKTYPVS